MSSNVEQIKSRLNIVDVAQSYIKLQKAGANFKASCPFHSEKTPSFFISPVRDSWHCFGCNRGGDIFSFVMEIEGVDFPEALRILADKAGIQLKKVDPRFISERAKILGLLSDSKNYYENELKKRNDVSSYLKDRGLKRETINFFAIGFVPDGWRNLYNFLKNKGYSDLEMEKSGMVIENQNAKIKNQNYYDRFRNRIIFPLFNSSGQIVGFSGRIFGQEDETSGGKYINTPQTILYDKSKILYCFDKAKNEIRKKDYCILVEGNTDAIMSHQAGIKNTVAVSGTAITNGHLEIIKRLTDNLIMAFDRDDAGFEAARRGIDLALKEGFDVKIALVSGGKDPADVIKNDVNLWKEAIRKSRHVIDFYLHLLSEKYTKDKRIFKKEVEKVVLPYLVSISSEIEKAHWVKEIAKHLDIKEEPVWEELKKISSFATEPVEETPLQIPQKTRRNLLEDRLTGIILWQRNKKDSDLEKDHLDDTCTKCQNLFSESKKNLLGGKTDMNLCGELIFEAELFYTGSMSLREEIDNLIVEPESEVIKDQLEEIGNKIRLAEVEENEPEIKKHLKQFQKLSKKLNELKN